MLHKLLQTPERRGTIAPEIIEFFATHDEGGDMLEKFILAFAGTSFTMPDHSFFARLNRDKELIRAVKRDGRPKAVIAAITSAGVSYAYLQNLWIAVEGRMLQGPEIHGGRAVAIEAAKDLLLEHPTATNDIVSIYTLNARERAECMLKVSAARAGNTNTPKSKPVTTPRSGNTRAARGDTGVEAAMRKRITGTQKTILAALRGAKKRLGGEEIRDAIGGSSVPTRSLNSLLDLGLISESKAGKFKCTNLGAEVSK